MPDSIHFTGGQLNLNEAYQRGVVPLELDNVPTDIGVRLDATTCQGVYGSNNGTLGYVHGDFL